jgi:MscS family membrane protein
MWEFLDIVFWHNSVKEWLFTAAWIAGGFIAGKICSFILAVVLRRVCSKNKYRLDDIVVTALARPLTTLIFLGGIYIAAAVLHVDETIELWIDRILASFFIVTIAWGANRLIDELIVQYLPENNIIKGKKREAVLQPVIRKLCKTLVWFIAIVLVLKSLGYNVSAMMAGLGLGGAAVALASRDTLANFFGSITVFVDRPFRLHDRIKITGYDGIITDMGIRTSRLRTLENRTVIIPNSVFAANPIENVSAEPHTKVTQSVNIKRENGLEKVTRGISLIKEICTDVNGTCGSPSAGIVSISGIICQVSFVYYVEKHADYPATVNQVNMEILRRFEEEGILLG